MNLPQRLEYPGLSSHYYNYYNIIITWSLENLFQIIILLLLFILNRLCPAWITEAVVFLRLSWWNHLRSLLFYIPWHCAFLDSDINKSWACWKDLLFKAIDECILKRAGEKRSNAPWTTKKRVLCKKKRTVYKRAQGTKLPFGKSIGN